MSHEFDEQLERAMCELILMSSGIDDLPMLREAFIAGWLRRAEQAVNAERALLERIETMRKERDQ